MKILHSIVFVFATVLQYIWFKDWALQYSLTFKIYCIILQGSSEQTYCKLRMIVHSLIWCFCLLLWFMTLQIEKLGIVTNKQTHGVPVCFKRLLLLNVPQWHLFWQGLLMWHSAIVSSQLHVQLGSSAKPLSPSGRGEQRITLQQSNIFLTLSHYPTAHSFTSQSCIHHLQILEQLC